jgi:hypothetical protein
LVGTKGVVRNSFQNLSQILVRLGVQLVMTVQLLRILL